ncbi:MAG: TlpA disulfide reductase family protein [Desulfovibrionaceae bacterium]|jgi:thiol-disulfide isomerase/thioredoxin|nr:TlpA disulfide reductase family protein [Desulfovibrionaceae bacterium]
MKKVIALVLLCLLLPVLSVAAERPAKLDTAGLSALVEKNKGKVLVVNFFATWCPPCRQEIPHLINTAKKYKDKVVFVGLSVDEDSDAVKPFMKTMGITYPVYLADESLLALFQVSSIPQNIIYGPDGVMRANHQGYVSEDMLQSFIKDLLEKK